LQPKTKKYGVLTMKMKLLFAIAMAAASLSAHAIALHGQTETAIYGSGNPDGNWTKDVNASSGVSVSLRGKDRATGSVASTSPGVWTFSTGLIPPNNNRSYDTLDFSFSSGQVPLTAYDYYLQIDTDPSSGVSYMTINPLLLYGDNSFGTGVTANGAGVEGSAALLASSNTIFQNSRNGAFPDLNHAPFTDATWDYTAFITEVGAGPNSRHLAEVSIQHVVGNGGATVPDGGATAGLMAVGVGSLALLRRKK
jgi:hypothetical protein